jgi:hypothetical protein
MCVLCVFSPGQVFAWLLQSTKVISAAVVCMQMSTPVWLGRTWLPATCLALHGSFVQGQHIKSAPESVAGIWLFGFLFIRWVEIIFPRIAK